MSNESEDLIYMPPPAPVIEDFFEKVKKIVGLSPNGVDPQIRFIWGMDATEVYKGEILQRYPDDSEPARYIGLPYFVLEGFQDSHVYNRAEWEVYKNDLGDYPEKGVWDFIQVLRTDDFEFMPLDDRALKMAYEHKFWRSKGAKRACKDLLARRQALRDLKAARFAAAKARILDDFVRDFTNAEQRGDTNADFSFSARHRGEEVSGYKRTPGGLLIPNV